jgi:hypothetical protein
MKLKELLEVAKLELKDLTKIPNPDFRLEQAIYKKNEKEWEIVVSYLVENTNKPINAFAALSVDFPYHRIYKKMIINDSNEVVGFLIFDDKV